MMREYRNRDSKTNDEETDPCIAAEIRMKKSALSSRTRRSLVALLIVLAVIASLSVLLFLILPRSKATSDSARYKGYDVFEVPAETTTFMTAPSAAVLYQKDADPASTKSDNLSRETASFHESESRDHSSSMDERHPDDKFSVLQPVKFEVREFPNSTSLGFMSDVPTRQSTQELSGAEATKLLATTTPSTFVTTEQFTTTNAEPKITEPRTTAVPLVPVMMRTLTNPDPSSTTEQATSASIDPAALNSVMTSTTTEKPFSTTTSLKTSLAGDSATTALASESTDDEKRTTSSPTVIVTTLAEERAGSHLADNTWSTIPPTEQPASLSASSVDQKTTTVASITSEQQSPSLGIILGTATTNMAVDNSDEQKSPFDVPDLTFLGDAETCEKHFARGERRNGIYSLALPKVGRFETLCDMTTTDGGWNVVQRRIDGAIEFETRTWDEYEHGFGQLNTSFWLGLEKIHSLVNEAKGRPLTLRIELRGDRCSAGNKCSQLPDGFWYGEWDFKIASAKENYTLSLSPAKAGNITEHTNLDKFYYMNDGQMFTTVDRDNDRKLNRNCAAYRDLGGWWHRDCGYVALNGRYNDTTEGSKGLFWSYSSRSRAGQTVISYTIKPRFTEMKVRLNI